MNNRKHFVMLLCCLMGLIAVVTLWIIDPMMLI